MRVALVGPFPPQEKGEAQYLRRYAAALMKYIPPSDIVIISQYDNKPSTGYWNGCLVHRAVRDRSHRLSYAAQSELTRAVIESGADIGHVHFGPNQDYGGRLGEPLIGALRALRRQGIKTVLTLHSQWMPNDVLRSAPARRFPRILRPLIVHYFGHFMRRLRASCDAFLCVVAAPNSAVASAFAQAYGLRDIGEELFSCSVDFSPLPQEGEPLIFSFGFLRPEKGLEVLIEGFIKYRKAGGSGRLVIAGKPVTSADRRYASMLRTLSAAHRDRIDFAERYLSEAEIDEYLRRCSVVVLPYLRSVGCSAPLHAALGIGRPVITTTIGHNATLGDAVRLVPAGSSDALAHELSRLFSVPDALEDAAKRAREAAAARTADRVAAHHYDLYRALVG